MKKLILAGLLLAAPAHALDWSQDSLVLVQGEIEPTMAINAATQIEELTNAGSKDIHVLINSQGGNVLAGYLIIGSINNARGRGATVSCAVPFLAASMALHILAYCDVRYALPDALLLFHEIRTSIADATPDKTGKTLTSLQILAAPLDANLMTQLGIDERAYRYFSEAQVLWPTLVFIDRFPRFGLKAVRFIKAPEGVSIFDIK